MAIPVNRVKGSSDHGTIVSLPSQQVYIPETREVRLGFCNGILLAGIRTPAKHIILFAWLVENKGNPKKAKEQKGELILVGSPQILKVHISLVGFMQPVLRSLTDRSIPQSARLRLKLI